MQGADTFEIESGLTRELLIGANLTIDAYIATRDGLALVFEDSFLAALRCFLRRAAKFRRAFIARLL